MSQNEWIFGKRKITMTLSKSSLLLLMFLLTGCATQSGNIRLSNDPKIEKLVIVITKPPKAIFYSKNNSGLISDIVGNVSMQPLIKVLDEINPTQYLRFAKNMSAQLSCRYSTTKIIPGLVESDPDYLKTLTEHPLYQATHIFFVKIITIGIERSYGFGIPLSSPYAYFKVTGELISIKDKKILWRYSVDVSQPIKGDWDQPPVYPNFQEAYLKAMKLAQNELLNHLN